MFNSKHVKQTTFPVNMLNLCRLWEPSAGIPKYCFKSHYSPQCRWKWWIYTSTLVNNCYSPKWRYIHVSTSFTDTEVNNYLSIYHTSWVNSGPKSNFICDNILTKAILFFFGYSEVNSTWLITSELANQCAYSLVWYILKDYICF